MTCHEKPDESILARFEKLFAKGSFQAAGRELAKYRKEIERPDLVEKLRICDEAVAHEKASETLKKARRCLKQNKLDDALRLFEDAFVTRKEDWIDDKIRELKTTLNRRGEETAALAAEHRGDFLAAAEIYGQRGAANGDLDGARRLKQAHCLVMAREWQAAVEVFQRCELKSARDRYDLGLALAMTGRFAACLLSWAELPGSNECFAAQIATVRALLTNKYRSISIPGDVFPEMVEELRTLFFRYEDPSLRTAAAHCRSLLVRRFLVEERYSDAMALLDDVETMSREMLSLAAKTSFLFLSDKKAQPTASRTADFSMYWLSALFHPEIWPHLSKDRESSDRTRRRLIERGEALVRSRTDESGRDNGWSVWQKERSVTEEIFALLYTPEDPPPPICTPRFAARFDRASAVSALLEQRSELLGDRDYLNVGAYYSKAAPALFFVEDKNLEKGSELIQQLSPCDPFSQTAVRLTAFCLGIACLESNDKAALKHLKTASPLFKTSKDLEDRIVEKAVEARQDLLELYEKVLEILVEEHPSPGLKRAFSTVRVRNAIYRYNLGRMTEEAMVFTAQKALALDPSNEVAAIAVRDARLNAEIKELNDAVFRHKMSRACEIVEKSQFSEVREEFFEMLEDIRDRFAEDDLETTEWSIILNDLRQWCVRIDPTHYLIEEIDEELEDLK